MRSAMPRAWPSPPTDNEVMLYQKGGVIAREIVASRVQAPPTFCTEAKVAKGGAYLRDTTVYEMNISNRTVPVVHLVANMHSQ